MSVEKTDQGPQKLPIGIRGPRVHRCGEHAVVAALQSYPAGIAAVGPLLATRPLRTGAMKRAASLAPQLEFLADEQTEQIDAGTRDHGEPDHAAPPRVATWPV